jgi:DNA-binding transcriptional LysR family regulator
VSAIGRSADADGTLEPTSFGRHSILTMVQGGVGISYGPRACIDPETFDRLDVVPLAGAPTWEFGVVTRDDGPSGAAGRAFLAAYLSRSRGRWDDAPE